MKNYQNVAVATNAVAQTCVRSHYRNQIDREKLIVKTFEHFWNSISVLLQRKH